MTVNLESLLKGTQALSNAMELRFCPASLEGIESVVAEEEAAQARRAVAAAYSAERTGGNRRSSAPAVVGVHGSKFAPSQSGR